MKRGQTTAFIILGLVIVTIIITVIVFREQLLAATFGKETQETITVPAQAEKVRVFVESCIKETAEDTLVTIGLQGGYATLPEEQFPPTPVYPFSTSIDTFGRSGVEVPFWFTELANGVQETFVPTKKQLAQNIGQLVDESLPSCLNDFAPLRSQGYDILPRDAETEVILDQEEVLFRVRMPIFMRINDFSFTFDTFTVRVAHPVLDLYERAKEVMQYENKEFFLEQRVVDMMVVYDEIPFSGVDFACSPKTWTKTDVYGSMKKILATNLPQIKVDRTKFDDTNIAKSFVIPAIKGRARDTTITFQYEESWPLLMEVIGEDEEILRGKPFTLDNEASQFLLPLFCLNDYHFVYNLKFPVVVNVEKNGNLFQFATLSIIQNNQPRENRVPLQTFEAETPVCDHPTKDIPVLVEGYRSGGFVQPLPGARVSFKCFNEVCQLGATNAATTSLKFPACLNGIVRAQKEGFLPAEKVVSTNSKSDKVTLTLEPIVEIPIKLTIVDEGNTRGPYDSEIVSMTFENTENGYTTTLLYPTQRTVKLTAGSYTITSTMMITGTNGIKLKEKEIEFCVDVPRKGLLGVAGLTTRECKTQTIAGTTVEQLVVGGSSDTWFAEREVLLTAQSIELFSYRGPTPKSIDEVGEVYKQIRAQEVPSPVLG